MPEIVIDRLVSFDDDSESDKNMKQAQSETGVHKGEQYRHGGTSADAFFQYEMAVDPSAPENYLGVRYFGRDNGRTFDVYLNDVLLKKEMITDTNGSDSWYVQWDRIPQEVIDGIDAGDSYKRTDSGEWVLDADGNRIPIVTVRFQSDGTSLVGGIFGLYTTTSPADGSDAAPPLDSRGGSGAARPRQ